MATVATPPLPTVLPRMQKDSLSTLQDPHTLSPTSTISRSDSDASHHPDLSDEIATLSSKLVQSINHQTTLDDELQAARHALDIARERMTTLQAADAAHQELLRTGQLRRKDEADKELADARRELAEEKERRKRLELEVNDLTASVFTEANNMVVAARLDKEAAEKRNEQLKNQLSDTETLLRSQQEQLQDLKAVVEKLSSEKDEFESNARASTAPSTPGMPPQEKTNRVPESASFIPVTPIVDEVQPDHPLKFSHLIHPVLRNDLHAYRDFAELVKMARSHTSTPPSRVSSGSFGSLNVLGLASGSGQPPQSPSPATPVLNQGAGSNSPRESSFAVPPLKDTKMYKRALAEDIEPTLRLEIAPGLSWLARRTVLNSITAGTFGIEPIPPAANKFRGPVNACSLCGENRRGDAYARKHRFRTSETDEAQRYPLCDYCLGRVRSSCDYISYLRMVRDGHWRAETDDEVSTAWEEGVRLRERMFWQRIGGGVVPVSLQRDSPGSPASPSANSSLESNTECRAGTEDPFRSRDFGKRASISKITLSHPDTVERTEPSARAANDNTEEEAALAFPDRTSESRHSKSGGGGEPITVAEDSRSEKENAATRTVESPPHEVKGLSIAIPGSFE